MPTVIVQSTGEHKLENKDELVGHITTAADKQQETYDARELTTCIYDKDFIEIITT